MRQHTPHLALLELGQRCRRARCSDASSSSSRRRLAVRSRLLLPAAAAAAPSLIAAVAGFDVAATGRGACAQAAIAAAAAAAAWGCLVRWKGLKRWHFAAAQGSAAGKVELQAICRKPKGQRVT
jgi:hypothetical protein